MGALAREEHEIEVAEGRHFSAAGAAQADQSETVDRRIQHSPADEIIGQPDELVVQESRGLRGGAAIAWLVGQPACDLGAAGGECFGENLAGFGCQIVAGAQAGQAIRDGTPIDDRALVGQPFMTAVGHWPLFACKAASATNSIWLGWTLPPRGL